MNRLLGSGAETMGRPLLGGIGSVYDASSARAGTGLAYQGISEAFSRLVQYSTSVINQSSSILSDYLPTDNFDPEQFVRGQVR